MRLSRRDLDQRDRGIAPAGEGREVDVELVGVEADRHVELEAGGDGRAGGGDVAGRKVTRPVVGSTVEAGAGDLLDAGDGDPHGAGDRLGDGRASRACSAAP